jgi:hypothetical protein
LPAVFLAGIAEIRVKSANAAQSVLNRKSEIVNRKLDNPAYKAAISPGPPILPLYTSHEPRATPHSLRQVSRTLDKFAPFMQNEPKFQNSQNRHTYFYHKGLRQYARLRITKNKPKTNPNEPKANPIFGPSGAPKAKTNPIKAKQSQFRKNPKNNATFFYTKAYENERLRGRRRSLCCPDEDFAFTDRQKC